MTNIPPFSVIDMETGTTFICSSETDSNLLIFISKDGSITRHQSRKSLYMALESGDYILTSLPSSVVIEPISEDEDLWEDIHDYRNYMERPLTIQISSKPYGYILKHELLSIPIMVNGLATLHSATAALATLDNLAYYDPS